MRVIWGRKSRCDAVSLCQAWVLLKSLDVHYHVFWCLFRQVRVGENLFDVDGIFVSYVGRESERSSGTILGNNADCLYGESEMGISTCVGRY